MRLGLAALRGSNPRSSALTSSFARALRLGGLLVSAFRGLCVAIAAIRPPITSSRYPRICHRAPPPDARTCRDGRTSPDYQAVRRFGSGSMVLASGSNADRRAWSTTRRQPRAQPPLRAAPGSGSGYVAAAQIRSFWCGVQGSLVRLRYSRSAGCSGAVLASVLRREWQPSTTGNHFRSGRGACGPSIPDRLRYPRARVAACRSR